MNPNFVCNQLLGGKTVTITVWDTYGPTEDKAFNATLASFAQAYPCIKVQVTPGVSIATANFVSAAKAGQAPNVYRDTSDDAGKLFAAGLLVNISQYINPADISASYIPIAVQNFMLGNSIYGLPDNVNYIVMYYNKKYLNNTLTQKMFGVNVDQLNTNQLLQLCQYINSTYKVWCIAYGAGQEWGYRFAAWFAGFGGQIFDQSGMPHLNSSAMIQAMHFWYNMTYVWKYNAPGVTPSIEQQLFTQNMTAIIFDGPWDLKIYQQALGPNLGAAPLPVISATGKRAAPFIGSTGWVIASPQASGASTQQIYASLAFVAYVTSKEAEMNLWNYAGDLPAQKDAYNSVMSLLTSGALQPAYMNDVYKGILEQAQYGQKFPNIPQMSFYWPCFHQYFTLFFANRTITADQAAQEMQSCMISNMQQAGLLPSSS
ncbi:MAG: extracellular solute-binding protein [Thermoproteus sp.]